jgi:hypothetical protein
MVPDSEYTAIYSVKIWKDLFVSLMLSTHISVVHWIGTGTDPNYLNITGTIYPSTVVM